MPRENLKDKLDGNELDLSMDGLASVPVKDLAALPKATCVDLSCNLLTSLPDAFGFLSHLVRLDLSRNSLQKLPDNFGQLINLQHLDLLENKLQILPLSFWQLKKLKWLDLKDNPLEVGLKHAAGDCLDESQCRKCAQQVLTYMKSVHSNIEKEREQVLQKKKEKDANSKAEELQRRKTEKLAEKERRRKEYKEKMAKVVEKETKKTPVKSTGKNLVIEENSKPKKKRHSTHIPPKSEKTGVGWCGLAVACCFVLIAVCLGMFVYCDTNHNVTTCRIVGEHIRKFSLQFKQLRWQV